MTGGSLVGVGLGVRLLGAGVVCSGVLGGGTLGRGGLAKVPRGAEERIGGGGNTR